MTSTAFLTRLHYPPGPRADWRFAFFEAMVLPRLRAEQVDVCAWVDNETHWERCLAMGVKPFTVTDEFRPESGYVKPGYEHKLPEYHVDFVPWRGVAGLGRYELQIAIDSDDLMLRPGLVQRMRDELRGIPEDQTAHVSVQPEAFDLERMMLVEFPLRYSVDKGSAIYALLQPSALRDEDYVFAYEDSHLTIGKRMQHRKFIDAAPGKCWVAACVHNWNESTMVKPDAREIVRRRSAPGEQT